MRELALKEHQQIGPFQWFQTFNRFAPFKSFRNLGLGGALPRFENSRNIEMSCHSSVSKTDCVIRRYLLRHGAGESGPVLSLVRPGKAESLHDLLLIPSHLGVMLPAQQGKLLAPRRLFMKRARS